MKIKFNREYLQVLAAFSAKDDVRAYLNGFHIKPHPEQRGVILTATNGHRLVTIYDEYGLTDGEYLFPITKELLAASKKVKTKDKRPLNEIQILDDKAYVLHAEEDVIDWFEIDEPEHIERVYHVEYIAPMGGEYPNTKRIFSEIKYQEASTVCFNPSYIGDLVKICLNGRVPQVNIMFCGNEGSVVAVGGFDKEITALIMPCKGEVEPIQLPEYVFLSGGVGVKTQEDKADLNLDLDCLYVEAVDFVKETRRVSVSGIQRKFRIGYNRSARLVEQLEENKIISVAGHNGAREVLI